MLNIKIKKRRKKKRKKTAKEEEIRKRQMMPLNPLYFCRAAYAVQLGVSIGSNGCGYTLKQRLPCEEEWSRWDGVRE